MTGASSWMRRARAGPEALRVARRRRRTRGAEGRRRRSRRRRRRAHGGAHPRGMPREIARIAWRVVYQRVEHPVRDDDLLAVVAESIVVSPKGPSRRATRRRRRRDHEANAGAARHRHPRCARRSSRVSFSDIHPDPDPVASIASAAASASASAATLAPSRSERLVRSLRGAPFPWSSKDPVRARRVRSFQERHSRPLWAHPGLPELGRAAARPGVRRRRWDHRRRPEALARLADGFDPRARHRSGRGLLAGRGNARPVPSRKRAARSRVVPIRSSRRRLGRRERASRTPPGSPWVSGSSWLSGSRLRSLPRAPGALGFAIVPGRWGSAPAPRLLLGARCGLRMLVQLRRHRDPLRTATCSSRGSSAGSERLTTGGPTGTSVTPRSDAGRRRRRGSSTGCPP